MGAEHEVARLVAVGEEVNLLASRPDPVHRRADLLDLRRLELHVFQADNQARELAVIGNVSEPVDQLTQSWFVARARQPGQGRRLFTGGMLDLDERHVLFSGIGRDGAMRPSSRLVGVSERTPTRLIPG